MVLGERGSVEGDRWYTGKSRVKKMKRGKCQFLNKI